MQEAFRISLTSTTQQILPFSLLITVTRCFQVHDLKTLVNSNTEKGGILLSSPNKTKKTNRFPSKCSKNYSNKSPQSPCGSKEANTSHHFCCAERGINKGPNEFLSVYYLDRCICESSQVSDELHSVWQISRSNMFILHTV